MRDEDCGVASGGLHCGGVGGVVVDLVGRGGPVVTIVDTTGEIVELPLSDLGRDQGVRSGTLDLDHVARLGEVLDDLPPIVVRLIDERHDLIDGGHRVAAHRLSGRTTIRAMVVQVSDARAVEWATSANVSHGRPLTTPDRKRAAERLMVLDPEMSDRSIAASCGLSPTTVGEIRSTVQSGQLNAAKRGGDGKKRPTPEQAKANRAKAEKIIETEPDTPVAKLAEQSGVSQGTAADVKKKAAAEPAEEESPRNHLRDVSATDEDRGRVAVADVVVEIPQSWARHPLAKRSNAGREFCGWMDRRSIRGDDPERIAAEFAEKCPPELLDAAIANARLNAQAWLAFAETAAARKPRPEVAR